jgi:hypothetical protein
MKIKDLRLELANAICNRHISKNNETAYVCKTCPLYLNDDYFCGRTLAYNNEKYGDKEIDFKECEDNEKEN